MTFAAFVDAIAAKGKGRKGAAKASRFRDDVCDHSYADGLDEQQTRAFLDGSGGLVGSQQDQSPKVASEPRVRRIFKREAP